MTYMMLCLNILYVLTFQFVLRVFEMVFGLVLQGMCLTKEQKPPMFIVAFVDWLWARVVAALLWPLHMLAKALIYKKIHASIGISKVLHTNYIFFFVRFISLTKIFLD